MQMKLDQGLKSCDYRVGDCPYCGKQEEECAKSKKSKMEGSGYSENGGIKSKKYESSFKGQGKTWKSMYKVDPLIRHSKLTVIEITPIACIDKFGMVQTQLGMINVKQLNDYFKNIQQAHSQVQGLFLATFTNSILASTQSNMVESSIYSTLLTDSHYIISFNLVQEDDKLPLQILIELENQWIFLYNIGIHFILGGVINQGQLHSGRTLMQQILANITTQMQHVDKWIEKDQK